MTLGVVIALAALTVAPCRGKEPAAEVDTSRGCPLRNPAPAPPDDEIFDCDLYRCAECGHSKAPFCCPGLEACDVVECSVSRCVECGDPEGPPCCPYGECVIKHGATDTPPSTRGATGGTWVGSATMPPTT
jgi:hypothetical protein